MDDERHFRNSFRDYDALRPDPEILKESGLSDNFLKLLRRHRNELLHKHFIEYSWHSDEDISVYTGKSGVAMMYLLVGSESKHNRGHLSDHPDDEINRIDFEARGLELLSECLPRLKKKRATFLCGDVGPLSLAAVHTKSHELLDTVMKFLPEVTQIRGSDMPDELLYGRGGFLFALNFLQKKFENSVADIDIKRVIDSIVESGQVESRRGQNFPPLMYQWHGKHYVGAAHGVVGILFMLLQNRHLLSEEVLNNFIKPTVEYLKHLQYDSGNFPSSLGSNHDRLIHWCHGAPGAIHLFIEAAKAMPDKRQEYMKIAERCADVIWQRGLLKKGYGLCHGVAGNGYAFLHMYQATGNQKYLYRAAKFGQFCFDFGKHGCRVADRPLSLFEGLAGTIYFLTELMNPATAKFPAFYF